MNISSVLKIIMFVLGSLRTYSTQFALTLVFFSSKHFVMQENYILTNFQAAMLADFRDKEFIHMNMEVNSPLTTSH